MYSNLSDSILKRKAIVDVVVKLMDEEGLKNVTIKDICEQANISVGAFYHYFSSKDSIPQEMYRLLDEYFFQKKDKILSHSTAKEDLLDFVSHFGMYVEEWGYYANLIIMRSSIENIPSKKSQEIRRIDGLLMDIIENGFKRKSFSIKIDAEELKSSIFLLIRGVLLEWAKKGPDYPVRDKLVAHIKWFLDGIQN